MKKAIDIQIDGVSYHCPFGLEFLGECLENLGLNVHQIGEKLDNNPFKWIPTLMYESIKLDKGELEFTYKEFVNKLDEDENGQKTMAAFLGAFVDSLRKDVPVQKVQKTNKTPSKKK